MAQLQEAQFACFEDEELDNAALLLSGTREGAFAGGPQLLTTAVKTFAIAGPTGSARSLPQKSFARVRSLECSGSGSFYFQSEALKDRFVCWRVIKNIVVLREWSLHETLTGNGIRLQFPAPVVGTGVHAVESWEGNSVTICVVTHAGTIHRFTYAIPATSTHSIFSSADASFPPKPATASKCDEVASLSPEEIITVALWVNEYNLVLGADSGRVIGVNFGVPSAPMPGGAPEMQEFAFSDESVVKWLWNGLVKSSTTWQSGGDKRQANAIVAMTCFPIASDDEDETDDVCVVTISADLTLRAWSYTSQSCLGKQQISSLVMADFDDEALDAYAVNAKLVALPATSTDNCRLLVHVDTTANYSQEIYLLRGDVTPLPSGGRRELSLTSGRVFTVESSSVHSKRLKLVDFAVDKNYLYSSWRSANGDFVYSHSNPMALTGPRLIRGEIVSSLNAQMQKYDVEDDEWPFDLKDEGVVALIDDFFAERVLLPGRFSRQNLYKAVLEYHGDLEIPLRPLFSSTGHQESKYKDLLVKIVSDKWLTTIGSSSTSDVSRHTRDPHMLRIGIWKSIIELCNKHWRVENVPIGFASTTNSLLPGSPVLLRRNRVSLLFPSAASITTPFLSKLNSNSADCVRELVAEILPVFDGFPSRSFQSFIHREVTDVVSDWKVESFVALARHCVRMGLKTASNNTVNPVSPDLVLTRALLRLSKILGGETEFHDQVLRDLVEHLFPFDASQESKSPSPKKRHTSYDDEDEDQAMENDDNEFASISRNLFGGNEICFAFDQVASRTIDEMSSQALRVVLFLSYLVDSQPAFVSSATLRNVARYYLPRSITIYQRWRLSRWISNQNITHATEIDTALSKASASLLPPLLQLFLLEANDNLNSSAALKRARSVLQIALMNNNVQSEEAHSVLGSFTREILRYVSQPTEPLVQFLQKRKQFSLLRSMFCCSLSDVSLHSIKYESPDQNPEVQKYVRSIGECLAREGSLSAREDDKEHAKWCFQQAIRCFSICLSSFLMEHDEPRFDQTAGRFIYDVIGLLKETIPRGYFEHMLGFLWTVATQALNRSGDEDTALQTFVWVNVFKYSVEEQQFRDAHLALMHTLDLSTSTLATQMTDDEVGTDALSTSAECVNYLVKELCRYGHLDLICEFQWGTLEPQVEKQIQWQAANANVIKDGAVDPAVVMFYNLLFAFYSRKKQPANAAAAMHALSLRLRLAQTKSAVSLQTQRNALSAASNSLLALPEANRWIVRKYHAEELVRSGLSKAVTPKENLPLNIVTSDDIALEIAVLDGKLQLLHLGHEESVLLSTMGGEEVVALLVDAALSCSEWTGPAAEKQQESSLAIELAADICKKSSVDYDAITKSMARYCVSVAHSVGIDSLCWRLLEEFLAAVDSVEQYEIAAATVLEWKVKIVLPAWLYGRLTHPKSGNPAKLLQLYLNYGLLIEAVKLADQMIPEELLNESEAGFRQRVTTPSSSLPWIPYNLFDSVIDAADKALSRGTGDRPDVMLRERVREFKEKLTSYFKYITLLEQARAAAGVARDATSGGAFSFSAPIRSAGAL
ncbi:Nucleoporin, partial [Globisporangium splendens]